MNDDQLMKFRVDILRHLIIEKKFSINDSISQLEKLENKIFKKVVTISAINTTAEQFQEYQKAKPFTLKEFRIEETAKSFILNYEIEEIARDYQIVIAKNASYLQIDSKNAGNVFLNTDRKILSAFKEIIEKALITEDEIKPSN